MIIPDPTYYRTLFAYEDWANRRALASLQPLGANGDGARRAMAHVVATRANWLARIHAQPLAHSFFPAWTVPQIEAGMLECEQAWKPYLEQMDAAALARVVGFRTLAGVAYERPLWHILTHVTHHGQHHRGQVASHVRLAGGQPASTDFMYYVE